MVAEEDEKEGEEMKRLSFILLFILLSGCVGITTGPQNKYIYPDAPDSPMVQYNSPLQSESRDICVNPADQGAILQNELEWQIVYEKMKAIIDAINGDL